MAGKMAVALSVAAGLSPCVWYFERERRPSPLFQMNSELQSLCTIVLVLHLFLSLLVFQASF